MLSLLRVFVFGLEGAARRQERHLFSCSENKLISDRDQRYYGETPVGLRSCQRAVGDAAAPIPPKTAKVAPGKLA